MEEMFAKPAIPLVGKMELATADATRLINRLRKRQMDMLARAAVAAGLHTTEKMMDKASQKEIYTMVKNNTFNGMPLPAIAVRRGGDCRIIKEFGYSDFKGRLS